MIEFGRFAAANREQRGQGKPETFKFLGFTFICGKSRAGKFLVKRKSRRDRMRAKLMEVREQLRQRMHQPIPEQGRWLRQVVTGFFNYHAVPTNFPALAAFRCHVIDLWRRSLQRRGQKDRTTWPWITKLAEDFLPRPRILHPWPEKRFAVRHPRWEPYAGMPHVRLCVQQRLACSAGERPAGVRVRSPVVWIAGWRETKTLKPIDNVSLGKTTSHRAVTTVNAKVASKVRSPEGRVLNRRAKAAWGSRNLTDAAPSLRRGGSDSTVARTC